MANKNFSQFSTGSTILDADNIVGYNNTNADGERKWTFGVLKNNISTSLAGSLVKAFGVIHQPSADTYSIISGSFNLASIVDPAPVTGADVRSLRIYFTNPVTNPVKAVLLSTTYGNAYLGYDVSADNGNALITSTTFMDIVWVDGSQNFEYMTVAVFC